MLCTPGQSLLDGWHSGDLDGNGSTWGDGDFGSDDRNWVVSALGSRTPRGKGPTVTRGLTRGRSALRVAFHDAGRSDSE